MRRILFFEMEIFTGATRVTRTIVKKVHRRYDTITVVISKDENVKNKIEDAIKLKKPDILFCSFSAINPDVILVGKKLGLTVVVRQDYKLSDLQDSEKQRIIGTYPKADFVIVQTTEMKQELLSYEELKDSRIKVIENPIDEEDILTKASAPNPFENNGKYHFLWVGRKDPIKDLPTLQKAFDIVHKHYPNTDLTLISGNPNPYRWMKHADCLVISSISEASPNVLKEAMFLGTKVISTDCSSIVREFVPINRIVEIGNCKKLAAAMMNEIYNGKLY